MSWEGPSSLGGTRPAIIAPSAVSRAVGSVDAFGAQQQPDATLALISFQYDGSWHGPDVQAGGVDIGSNGVAAIATGDRFDVFAVDRSSDPAGNFGVVLAHWWRVGDTWSGPERLPQGPADTATNTAPAVVSLSPGTFEVFFPAGWHESQILWWSFDGTSWSAPQALPVTPTLSVNMMAAVKSGTDRIDVFATDVASNQLAHWTREAGAWSAPELLGGQVEFDAPLSAVSWAPGRIDVFGAGGTGPMGTSVSLLHWWFDGSWHGPETLGTELSTDPSGACAVSQGPGLLDVFAFHDLGELMHWSYDGAWHGPTLLGGDCSRTPGAVSQTPGRLDVFGLDQGSGTYVRWTWRRNGFVLLERSTLGKGEIDALHAASGWPAVVNPALEVVLEGYSAEDLGGLDAGNLGSPPRLPSVTTSDSSVTAQFHGPVVAEDITLPSSQPQRFIFPFQLSFADDSAFDFSGDSAALAVQATFTPVSGEAFAGEAVIVLVPSPNPYIMHGDAANGFTWYLSVDTRVFQVREGHARFGTPDISTTASARDASTAFIQRAIQNLNGDASLGAEFLALPQDEASSSLMLAPRDSADERVFNFAVARVHYRDLTQDVSEVRAFFRLWAAQQTNASYGDTFYPQVGPNPDGQPIPSLGTSEEQIVTIPFFASGRVASSVSMAQQTDAFNVQSFFHGAQESVRYFGCWLDINQPDDLVFPAPPFIGSPSGPFSGTLISIQQLLRSQHQCLLVEISFPGLTIPPGADPSSSDKLAQRNLALVAAPNPGQPDSRLVPQTFEIRPSPARLLADERPDELSIEWGRTPRGSRAQIYLPEADAAGILRMADRLYGVHGLSLVDAHTIGCTTGGATFVPVPSGAKVSFVGLLSVELAAGVKRGDRYEIVVRQLTSAQRALPVKRREKTRAPSGSAVARKTVVFRKVLGTFRLSVPIHATEDKPRLLDEERRLLSILRWIREAMTPKDRWLLVFERYLGQVAQRVAGLGGDPGEVRANGNGNWRSAQKTRGVTGKVCGLLYDHFGDFQGFVLTTEECGRREIRSHERKVEEVIHRAWKDRATVEALLDPAGCLQALFIGGEPTCGDPRRLEPTGH